MLGAEPIHIINKRLLDVFGKTDEGLPRWKIVWSHDEFEKRSGTFTKFDEHQNIIGEYTAVELRPKYRHYISNKFVLERHLYIPEDVETDLVEKFSYEPVWVFQTSTGDALPPKWEAILLLITTINSKAMAVSQGPKYKQTNEDYTNEQLKSKIQTYEELHGNETSLGDSLHLGNATGFTTSKIKDN